MTLRIQDFSVIASKKGPTVYFKLLPLLAIIPTFERFPHTRKGVSVLDEVQFLRKCIVFLIVTFFSIGAIVRAGAAASWSFAVVCDQQDKDGSYGQSPAADPHERSLQ